MRIEVPEVVAEADMKALSAGLHAHTAAAGIVLERKPIAVFAKDESDKTVGGASGYTWGGWLFVNGLWVDEGARKHGLGRKLMTAIESAAAARGCHHVHLDTFDFQAPDFYRSLGYREFAVLDDYPIGHRRFFLAKQIANG
jgi:GNAT superfamily N-acetyltransferase